MMDAGDIKIPLYVQVREDLKRRILKGEYLPGEQIPTENELCKRYNVSRITVEKALASLVHERLLERKQGKGSYVSSDKIRRRLPRLYSFTEDMRELGLEPSSVVLDLAAADADEEERDLLVLPESDAKVIRIRRVRLANGKPILLEETLVPRYLCPDLEKQNLEKGSLYEILRSQYGLSMDHAEETYEVTIVDKETAKLLECGIGQPAFSIERIAYLKNGSPFELTSSVGRGDRLRFTLELVSDTARFMRKVDV